ncbi:MAG: biopolymer transporter ExbD [Chitinophagaceae bacterium]|nr:MAG: biopolymer transporter ExbD [Chitinophagaceae bacterium]
MALKSRNRANATFNMSSLTDIIFLLLIFFMLTSTLVSPNALKLLLPSSKSQTMAKTTVSVSITENIDYYIGTRQIMADNLEEELLNELRGIEEPTVVLNAEKSVPIEYVVKVMDIANKLKVDMILATQPN